MRIKYWILGSIAALCIGLGQASMADTPASLPQDDVLAYLEQLIQWQRNAAAIDPASDSARERIFHDTLQGNSEKALKSGFKFAQQQAAIATPETEEATPTTDGEPPQETPRQRMTRRAAETDQQVASLQKSLSARSLSKAQRESLSNNLKLALAKQELYKTVLSNMTSASNNGGKDLASKIAALAREIPELHTDMKPDKENVPANTAAPGATTPAGTTVTAHPTVSIFTLATSLFDNIRKQRELRDFRQQTEQLEQSSRSLIKGLRNALDAITGAPNKDATIDEQVATFKQIGAQIIPVGDATMWIRTSKTTLDDWTTTLDNAFKSLLRQLLIQVALLAITLMIPLLIGECAKRAINRYVTDPKRKRQANSARRILVSLAILFILLLNFISDFSSFATFFGFMTAGLAVALQSVLLSLVGHFFFYGRYGVRQGDRVKVGNVTGDIVQVGMIRFYLRELHAMEDGSMKPSGKIVAFPNSILFQPTAFYKFVDDVR